MRKRLQIALAVLLVAIAGGIAWQVLREREPVYKGKPVTVWIRDGYLRSGSGVTPQQANEAVLAVGTNGLPYYVMLLETKADSPIKLKILRFLRDQPWLKFDVARWEAGYRRAGGAYALSILGPEAKQAIPALTKLLTSADENQRGSAALTLPDIGPEGIQPLTNLLMTFPNTPHPAFRFRATS